MQLHFCHPVLPAGSWEHPDGCGWERRAAQGEFRAVQICRVCARLVPLFMMPQASISPGFILIWGKAAQFVITMRLERLGGDQGPDPLCVQCCDLVLQALAPAGPVVLSAFVSHVTSAGKIELSGKVAEGKCSEKTDFQVLPV